MRHSIRKRSVPAVLFTALALLACSGDDDDPPQQATQNPPGQNPPGENPPAQDPPAALSSRALWVAGASDTRLTAEQRTAYAAGNLYFNAHTAANPAGEIRGQLDGPGTAKLASLSGAQETPAVTTSAFGAGVLIVDESSGRVSGFVATSGLTGATAAHVHLAARGTPGPIIVPLTGGPELWVVPDGAAPLGAEQVAAFQRNELYFNVHTAANPNGEIRGQLDKAGPTRLAALSGAQETPSVTTSAFGGGILAVGGDGRPAGFVVTKGLVGATAAHVHLAPRGTPGPIVVPLTSGP